MECKEGYKEKDGKCVKKKESVFSLVKRGLSKGPKSDSSNGLKIFLGIALALILFGLFNLGVATFYDSPDYSDYCNSSTMYIDGDVTKGVDQQAISECETAYDDARDRYENNIFYIFVIGGLILAISGLFIGNLSFQIVGLGSGVALIIEGILKNLDNKVPAFIAGLVVFGILSFFVWRKVK